MRQVPTKDKGGNEAAAVVQLSPADPRGRAGDWLLAAEAASRAAQDLRSVGLALEGAQRDGADAWIVPDGTAARMGRARAKTSLLIDLVARSIQ
jgi:hypothetical protein